MRTLRTNSDLYQAVVELGRREPARERPLESYLRALWSAGYDHCDADTLSLADVVALLAGALDGPAPPPDPRWEREDLTLTDGADPFTGWARTLRAQVCDLRELTAAGAYSNPSRYLGLIAPRPSGQHRRPTAPTWYNFDVASYLECAAVGAFGGWRPEFEDAQVDTAPPDPVPLAGLSWADLTRFAICGQAHE